MRLVRGHARRKRLYVIRHGESEWNKAQSGLDLPSMYAQVDHPLSAEGRRQAEALGKTIGASLADGAGDESAALRELRARSSSPLLSQRCKRVSSYLAARCVSSSSR